VATPPRLGLVEILSARTGKLWVPNMLDLLPDDLMFSMHGKGSYCIPFKTLVRRRFTYADRLFIIDATGAHAIPVEVDDDQRQEVGGEPAGKDGEGI
jgi:hypothetical protein